MEGLGTMTEAERKRISDYMKILKMEPMLYRTAEMICHNTDDFSQSLYYTVFAPALVRFIEWVLYEAERKGRYRLYFLARDGYQMYLTARELCKKRGLNIDCRYLYGSRYAWRMPQFVMMGEDCLDMLCRGGIDVTFEKVMKRGGLTEEEAEAVAKELGFGQDYRRVLSYSEVIKLKMPLRESRIFLPYVYEHSKAAYEATMGYLEQEGLFEDVPYALVDSGWTGSLQETLYQLLKDAGYEKRIEGFYFGLYELPGGVQKNSYHTYYFGPKYGLKRKVYFSNCLYEAVYSAPHGMTTGYNGQQPVFNKPDNLNQTCMEQEIFWLEQFLSMYEVQDNRNVVFCKEGSVKQVYRLFKQFMGRPSKEEAAAYGNLMFSDDVTEEHTRKVAAEMDREDIRNQRFFRKLLIMTGIQKGKLHDSAWLEGSIVRNGTGVRTALFHAVFYKYLVYIRKVIKQ